MARMKLPRLPEAPPPVMSSEQLRGLLDVWNAIRHSPADATRRCCGSSWTRALAAARFSACGLKTWTSMGADSITRARSRPRRPAGPKPPAGPRPGAGPGAACRLPDRLRRKDRWTVAAVPGRERRSRMPPPDGRVTPPTHRRPASSLRAGNGRCLPDYGPCRYQRCTGTSPHGSTC